MQVSTFLYLTQNRIPFFFRAAASEYSSYPGIKTLESRVAALNIQ